MKEYSYLFKSERLGFRLWYKEDLAFLVALNGNEDVMKYFPNRLSTNESERFFIRLQEHYETYGFTYYAVEIIETGELIGFIGLANQTYTAPFTPAVDIGWRLTKSAWGQGYATEGARRCLDFAFTRLGLGSIVSTCPIVNTNSENVMKRLGMKKKGVYKHPMLQDFPLLEECVWYEIAINQ